MTSSQRPRREIGGLAASAGGDGDGDGDDRDLVTEDTLLEGRVHLVQPLRGFRSSLDPLLLASFVAGPMGRFVDIGCGTGALAFLLADKDPGASGVAIEIQARLADLARRGLTRNNYSDRLHIVNDDIRSAMGRALLPRAGFDLVAINPPFRSEQSGVTSPDPERAQANHEVSLSLDEWLDCAVSLLRPRGRLAAIYPADRLVSLVTGCEARRLSVARLRVVHAHADRPASRLLLEARLHGRQTLTVEPPLVLHEADGSFRAEVADMLGRPRR